jgi:hypothetical protein
VILSDVNVCDPDFGCLLTVAMTTVDNVTYHSGASSAPMIKTLCEVRDHPYTVVTNCTNGFNVTTECSGTSFYTINSQCPYAMYVPSCGRIGKSSVALNDVCYATVYDKYSTTCRCQVPKNMFTTDFTSSKSRRLFVDPAYATPGVLELGVITTRVIVGTPTMTPTAYPTRAPTRRPTNTRKPTHHGQPTDWPTREPTEPPTPIPTPLPQLIKLSVTQVRQCHVSFLFSVQ